MKIRSKNVGLSLLFVILLFITCLDSITSNVVLQFVLKHVDEMLVVALICYILINIAYLHEKQRMIVTWGAFIAIGIISAIVYRYQTFFASAVDCVLVINKFVAGYLSAYIYTKKNHKPITQCVRYAARITVIILFVFALHDFIFPSFFEKADYRYFAYSLKLMFPHATYLAAAASTLLVYFGYLNCKGRYLPEMIMASFLLFTTLRGKAIGFLLIYWLLYVFFFVFQYKHYVLIMAGGALAVFLISADQIRQYFVTSGYSPRQILLRDSLMLANEHFPLGTGFGTFGSSMAADRYSILYRQLGYTRNYGMGETGSMFLTDSFWPIIFAQFGWIGTIVFVLFIVGLFFLCFRTIRKHRYAGFSMLVIMIDMMINSIAETAFFNPASMLLFMLFAVFEAESGICTERSNTGDDKNFICNA